ncbi:uncharacterized protein RCO7_01488 [Rhynchosporium graminicola]|uniref:Uncharacterized protein n=1 Tax=Rhynchosporium graminicola TaxID=2792576 RepID=A0A1E1JZG8_9HELO|nr:uncharacterized protein RCO7_01488 [Rhynchosporium commune]
MAAVHGRYLGIQPTAKHSTREFSHSSQCTASFSKCLKEDIKEEQREAIWATAVMLANIAFASLNISSHEDAWPLKMSDPSDLQWLRLKVSDKALWKIADPMRPSSAFWKISNTFSDILQVSPQEVSMEFLQDSRKYAASTARLPPRTKYTLHLHTLFRDSWVYRKVLLHEAKYSRS